VHTRHMSVVMLVRHEIGSHRLHKVVLERGHLLDVLELSR
jgi:hypothetical protein